MCYVIYLSYSLEMLFTLCQSTNNNLDHLLVTHDNIELFTWVLCTQEYVGNCTMYNSIDILLKAMFKVEYSMYQRENRDMYILMMLDLKISHSHRLQSLPTSAITSPYCVCLSFFSVMSIIKKVSQHCMACFIGPNMFHQIHLVMFGNYDYFWSCVIILNILFKDTQHLLPFLPIKLAWR